MARVDDPLVADRDLVLPSGDPLDLPTEPDSDGPSMAAEVFGRVGLDPAGCVTLDGQASVWPHGWTAWQVEDRLVLLDEQGAIAAREGDRIEGGGGYTHFHGAGRCAPDGEIAHVQTDVVVTDRG